MEELLDHFDITIIAPNGVRVADTHYTRTQQFGWPRQISLFTGEPNRIMHSRRYIEFIPAINYVNPGWRIELVPRKIVVI